MKYSIVSDLHLDFGGWQFRDQPLEEVVVVAGDTTNGLSGLKFLNKLRSAGHTVIACDGNHEHYSNRNQHRSIQDTTLRFREDFQNRIDIGTTRFLCFNGWYQIEAPDIWRKYMNDFFCGDANEINMVCNNQTWELESQLRKCRKDDVKAVVVTHTAPGPETLDEKFEGSFSNAWYMNPHMNFLRREFSDVILVWNHGHTHAPADKIIDGVRTVCNPRGYQSYGENPDWKPITIEI